MGVLHSGSSNGVASPGAYDSDNGYLSSTPSPGTHHVVPEQSKRPLPLLSDTVDLVPALSDASNQATGQANFTPELSADLLDSIAEADSEAVPDIGLLVPDLATVLDGTETGSSDMQVEQIDLPLIDDLATLSLPTTVRMCLNCSEHSPPPTKTEVRTCGLSCQSKTTAFDSSTVLKSKTTAFDSSTVLVVVAAGLSGRYRTDPPGRAWQ